MCEKVDISQFFQNYRYISIIAIAAYFVFYVSIAYRCPYAGDVEYVSMYLYDYYIYRYYFPLGTCFRSYEFCSYSWYYQYYRLFCYYDSNLNCSKLFTKRMCMIIFEVMHCSLNCIYVPNST